ncbi:MAG: cupin domain-containing protein [Burkholderiales bacterium]
MAYNMEIHAWRDKTIPIMTIQPLPQLGGLSAAQFLREYWQKKPLLIRDAFPGFHGLIALKDLFALTRNETVQSRLVQRRPDKWHLQHGPLAKKTLRELPAKNWTLLVQELNLHVPAAAELLQHFSFIPHARLDDLMVSYAAPGGGVGAHVDSYDVFLLQGEGKRRWEIARQKDLSLVPDAPLKLLKKFTPQTEWTLGPGDMLYLPPNFAHKGTAINACTSYSIGFRAPSHQELATEFLVYLQDHIALTGMYSDPNLKPQKHAAEINRDMLNQTADILKKIKYNQLVIASFLGKYLSEPKPYIFFDAPEEKISEKTFFMRARSRAVLLAPASKLLFIKGQFFINGEEFYADKAAQKFFTRLADMRRAPLAPRPPAAVIARLCEWYNNGYVSFVP